MKIDYDTVLEEYLNISDIKSKLDDSIENDDDIFGPSESDYQKTEKSKTSGSTPTLDNFGRDLTKYAEENRLDPIVGRISEIERVAQILSRRKKNNPILVGEPGVGKSAIAEGLAIRIVERKVSRVLFDKRVVMLDLAALVAGTKYRGQFEERMKALISELENNPSNFIYRRNSYFSWCRWSNWFS